MEHRQWHNYWFEPGCGKVAGTMLRRPKLPEERNEPTTIRVTAIIEFSPLD